MSDAWVVAEDPGSGQNGDVAIRDHHGRLIAIIYLIEATKEGRDRTLERARTIASAPEMLTALDNILKCTPNIRCHGDFANCELLFDCGDPFEIARVTIAKTAKS